MHRLGIVDRLRRKSNQRLVLGRSFGLSSSEFEVAFQREKSLADRGLRSFSLVVFLPCEDSDESLRALGRILEDRLRVSDIAGRLDAEIAAVLLPETDERGANAMADAVMSQLAKAGLKFDFEVYAYPGRTGNQDGHSSNGHSSNGHSSNGHSSNGHSSNGHSSNGHASNGHSSNGHASNGHSSNGHASNGHASNGHASNGHASDGITSDGHAEESHSGSPAEPSKVDGEDLAPVNKELAPTVEDHQQSELAAIRASVRRDGSQDLRALCYEPISFRKRALDVVVAGGLFIALSPLLVLVALVVKLTSPGPIFFTQKRAGQGGVPFDFYKFRSMYIDAEERKAALADSNEQDGPIFKMKNDPRMTPVGRILRRTSIDELPQLYNILRGDMTLVGPRPPTLDEVEDYEPWQLERLRLKGGLTCIWQVSGRSEIGFEEWVRMDLRYAQKRGVAMDLGLLARTAKAVVSGRGAY